MKIPAINATDTTTIAIMAPYDKPEDPEMPPLAFNVV